MGKWVGNAVSAITLGTVDPNKGREKKAKMKGYAEGMSASMREEAGDALRRRKALYETEGGILGQEVESVDEKRRGSLFGNVR